MRAQSVLLVPANDEPSELDGPVSCAADSFGEQQPGRFSAIVTAAVFGLCAAAFAAGVVFCGLDFACR